jgi:hypothetical protein
MTGRWWTKGRTCATLFFTANDGPHAKPWWLYPEGVA